VRRSIQFVYSDSCDNFTGDDCVDVLIASNRLLLPRLKELMEGGCVLFVSLLFVSNGIGGFCSPDRCLFFVCMERDCKILRLLLTCRLHTSFFAVEIMKGIDDTNVGFVFECGIMANR
jgi:hypothetical protein